MIDWELAGQRVRNDDTVDSGGPSGCYPVGRVLKNDRLVRRESEQRECALIDVRVWLDTGNILSADDNVELLENPQTGELFSNPVPPRA